MRTRNFIIFIIFFALFHLTETNVLAGSFEKATIVDFNVKVNGTLINNINSDYPMLRYKNITYFPLTWDYCSYLGLKINWSNSSGLEVSKSGQFSDYKVTENTSCINLADTSLPVTVPTYPITINGIKIKNSIEQWPLINYRGITYCPLTWRFAVEMFGWEYAWSDEKGLFLSCPGGKPAPNETVLTIINRMTFGKGYRFHASITDKTTQNTYNGFVGEVKNNVESFIFKATVKLITNPLKDSNVNLEDIYTGYQGFNVNSNNGFSCHFTSTDYPDKALAVGPTLNDRKEYKMLSNLLYMHFVGNGRKDIISVDRLETLNGTSKWVIKLKDKSIEVEVLDNENIISTITIMDDSFLYSYKLLSS